MHVRRHSSGTGWTYQKLIPRSLRALFGKAHFNRYISPKVAPDKHTANRIATRWAMEDDATVQHIKTLTEQERAVVFAAGLPALRQRVADLGVAITRHATMDEFMEVARPREWLPAHRASETAEIQAAIFEDMRRQQAEAEELASTHALVAKADGKPRSIGNGMRELFDLWVKRKGAKITRNHKATVERFIAVSGDLSVRDIKRDHIRAFYTANEAEKLGRAAQEKHRDHLKALFAMALSEGWIDAAPTAGIMLNAAPREEGDDDDDGKPFTPAQLRHILAKAQETRFGGDRHDDYMLILRTLIYSGARSEEIAQLRPDDIETIDGVPAMRIRERPELLTSVKNKPSRRIVPLHKEIAADVLARAGDGNEWLFPSLLHDKRGGHGRTLRGAFNGREGQSFLRVTCGIVDPDLSLHSTRHSFIDACRRSGIAEDTERRIVGHGKPDVHAKYGRGAGLEAMAAALQGVEPLA